MSGPKGVVLITMAPSMVAGLAGGLVVAGIVAYAISAQIRKAERESLKKALLACAAELEALGESGESLLASLDNKDCEMREGALADGKKRLASVRGEIAQRFWKLQEAQERIGRKSKEVREMVERVLSEDWMEAERERVMAAVEKKMGSIPVFSVPPADFSREGIGRMKEGERVLDEILGICEGIVDFVCEEAGRVSLDERREHREGAVPVPRKLEEVLAEIRQEGQGFPKNPIPEKLEVLVGQAALLESSGCWSHLLQRVAEIRKEPDRERQRLFYNDLVITCSQQIRLQQEHEAWVRETSGLVERARAFEVVPGREECVAELESVLRAGAMVGLEPFRQKIAELEKEEGEIRLQEEKRRAICESLQSLGYVVGEGEMGAALAENGKIVVKKSQESEYGIEVVTGEDASVLQTAMVRYGEAGGMSDQQRMRDIVEEKGWCADYAKLLKSLETKGIQAAKKYQLAPGEHPVKVIAAESEERKKVADAAKEQGRKQG